MKTKILTGIVLICISALCACGTGASESTTPTKSASPSVKPEYTVTPAPTETSVPTATSAPTATSVPVATKEPTATPEPTATIAPSATKAANDSEHVVVYEYLLSHYKIKDDDGKESDFYPDLTLSFTTISVYRYGDKTKIRKSGPDSPKRRPI